MVVAAAAADTSSYNVRLVGSDSRNRGRGGGRGSDKSSYAPRTTNQVKPNTMSPRFSSKIRENLI